LHLDILGRAVDGLLGSALPVNELKSIFKPGSSVGAGDVREIDLPAFLPGATSRAGRLATGDRRLAEVLVYLVRRCFGNARLHLNN